VIFANKNGGKFSHSNFFSAPKRAGVEAGTLHSWRSVFRDTVEDKLHLRPEAAEASLGHSLGAVEGAYRRDTGVEARRVMMEAYSQHLMGTGADNVVPFEKKMSV
jgi:hypothetical protein